MIRTAAGFTLVGRRGLGRLFSVERILLGVGFITYAVESIPGAFMFSTVLVKVPEQLPLRLDGRFLHAIGEGAEKFL